MIHSGKRLRFIEHGALCCECPAMDARTDLPANYHIRVGKGLPPYAFHQDCANYAANQDRLRLVNYPTDTGIIVKVIYLEGDHDDITGGAYLLKALDYPTDWNEQRGIRTRFVFSPQEDVNTTWYLNYELRGTLAFTAHNEGSAALGVAIRNRLIKVMYYVDAVDGQGGGTRQYFEFPFAFEQFKWYELVTRLTPVIDLTNTWNVKVRLTALHNRLQRIVWNAPSELRPNRIVTLDYAGCGDEHQGLADGGRWLISVNEDKRIEPFRFGQG